MNVNRIAILFGATCTVLSIILAVLAIQYTSALNNENSQITDLKEEVDTLKLQVSSLQNSDIANLTKQITEKNAQIANLSDTIAALNSQIANLQIQLSQNGTSELTMQQKIRDSVMSPIIRMRWVCAEAAVAPAINA